MHEKERKEKKSNNQNEWLTKTSVLLLLEENAYNKGSFTVQKCFLRYEDYVTWSILTCDLLCINAL